MGKYEWNISKCEAWRGTSLDELEMSVRTHNKISNMIQEGIIPSNATIGAIADLSDQQMLKIMGPKSLNEIKEVIAELREKYGSCKCYDGVEHLSSEIAQAIERAQNNAGLTTIQIVGVLEYHKLIMFRKSLGN